MTPDRFRQLVLALPEAVESEHMGHPDFRVRGRIFATLDAEETHGVLKLTLDEQDAFMQRDPDAFRPVPGGWGRRGYTQVVLRAARVSDVRDGLTLAWRKTAPKALRDADQSRS